MTALDGPCFEGHPSVAAALELVPSPLRTAAPVGHRRLRLSMGRGPTLRRRLVALDAVAVALAWLASWPLAAGPDHRSLADASVLLGVTAVTAVTLLAAASQHLYLARVSSVRAYEVVRLGRVAFMSSVAALLVDAFQVSELAPVRLAVGGILAFALLTTFRGWFARWLRGQRAQGAFSRPMVVVANGDDAANLITLLQDHPEMGFAPAGVVGDRPETPDAEVSDVRWLGQTQDTLGVVARTGATGVIIAAGALPSDQLNRLVRDLHQANVHVHLSSGLTGFHHRRLRMAPMAHEPLLYLEAMALSRAQLAAKRALDLSAASVLLVLALPVLAIAAMAVKATSPGPILFRQQRVGRHGRLFTVLKLRTMHRDAELRLDEVRHLNQRSGPLFKLDRDPRVTRVGRFLRDTSIDELPQLLNVLAGTMSMVGPRPALPDEVARFDDDLLGRHQVLPGVSGLWQVEARDNASFSAYRRLDLFYAENWSVGLDLAVLLATVQAVLGRALRVLPARAASRRSLQEPEAPAQPAVVAFEVGQ
ncbi:MAG: sugar transferase [Actinobacteria bacterium]|nr:sugar transferase [Actinomycetota bacterium]